MIEHRHIRLTGVQCHTVPSTPHPITSNAQQSSCASTAGHAPLVDIMVRTTVSAQQAQLVCRGVCAAQHLPASEESEKHVEAKVALVIKS